MCVSKCVGGVDAAGWAGGGGVSDATTCCTPWGSQLGQGCRLLAHPLPGLPPPCPEFGGGVPREAGLCWGQDATGTSLEAWWLPALREGSLAKWPQALGLALSWSRATATPCPCLRSPSPTLCLPPPSIPHCPLLPQGRTEPSEAWVWARGGQGWKRGGPSCPPHPWACLVPRRPERGRWADCLLYVPSPVLARVPSSWGRAHTGCGPTLAKGSSEVSRLSCAGRNTDSWTNL